MSTPKSETFTIVVHVGQSSFSNGIEWESWSDLPGDGDEDVYATMGKVELFHHFMMHGVYPEAYMQDPLVQLIMPQMQAIRRAVIAARAKDGIKLRTRIVRRTIVSTVTDEEVDKPMLVKNGEKT